MKEDQQTNLLRICSLIDHIQTIAVIIDFQCPLSTQDKWLDKMVKEGLYSPDTYDSPKAIIDKVTK